MMKQHHHLRTRDLQTVLLCITTQHQDHHGAVNLTLIPNSLICNTSRVINIRNRCTHNVQFPPLTNGNHNFKSSVQKLALFIAA